MIGRKITPAGADTINAANSAAKDDMVHVTANASPGWEFVGWTTDGPPLADASKKTTTFTMPEKAVTVEAEFRMVMHTVTIGPLTGGKISVDGGEAMVLGTISVQENKACSIEVVADPGWYFWSWGADPRPVSSDFSGMAAYFRAQQDFTLSATFEQAYVPIYMDTEGITNSDAEGAAESGGNGYSFLAKAGERVEVRAIPGIGEEFVE